MNAIQTLHYRKIYFGNSVIITVVLLVGLILNLPFFPPYHSYLALAISLFLYVYSFQVRMNTCVRQMAEILYQIKGPLNQNTRNTAEADADNALRPLMEFLDTKSVQLNLL